MKHEFRNITEKTLRKAYKPYDVVSDKDGNVGFIQEISLNDCQPDPVHQVDYAIRWLVGNNRKFAWFHHEELTRHCNLFVKIAESSCNPHTGSEHVSSLMNMDYGSEY